MLPTLVEAVTAVATVPPSLGAILGVVLAETSGAAFRGHVSGALYWNFSCARTTDQHFLGLYSFLATNFEPHMHEHVCALMSFVVATEFTAAVWGALCPLAASSPQLLLGMCRTSGPQGPHKHRSCGHRQYFW